MAIARTGHILGAISGSLGSIIFANTRQGLLIKNRPLKNNQATERQLHARATFRTAQIHWQHLTQAQRAPWLIAAFNNPVTNRLGLKSPLSPFQYFLHSQATTAFWGQPFWTTPPPGPKIPSIDNATLTFTEGGPFTILIEISPIARYAVVKAHRPFAAVAPMTPNRWVTLGRYSFTEFDSFNIYPEFIATLGIPVAGEALTISIVISAYLWYTSPWPPLKFTPKILAP